MEWMQRLHLSSDAAVVQDVRGSSTSDYSSHHPLVVSVDRQAVRRINSNHVSLATDISDHHALRRDLMRALSNPPPISLTSSSSLQGAQHRLSAPPNTPWVDVFLHDGVSVVAGQHSYSVLYAQNHLVLQVLQFVCRWFKDQLKASSQGRPSGGRGRGDKELVAPVGFLTKLFHSPTHSPLVLEAAGSFFKEVTPHRCCASAPGSSEEYLVCYGFGLSQWNRYCAATRRRHLHDVNQRSPSRRVGRKNVFSLPPRREDVVSGRQLVWKCIGCQQVRYGPAVCPLCYY